MKKKILHKIWDIFSSLLLTIIILGGAVLAFMYAKGYRINLIDRTVKQTGVLNVEGKPTKANLYINDKYIGKTPKVVSSIDVGDINVKITKEEYNDWIKKVGIFPERSSSIEPYLVLSIPTLENVYSKEEKVIKAIQNQSEGIIVILTFNTQNSKYSLYKYYINKPFWDFADNPQLLHSFDKGTTKEVSLEISKDGKWALITSKTDKNIYTFVHISIPNQVITETDLNVFDSQYTRYWANDSSYMILESKNDIFSYKVEDNTKFLLMKKSSNTKYIWTTDSNGSFYYLQSKKDGDFIAYSLTQLTLQGNAKKVILDNIYFLNSDKYVNEIREGFDTKYLELTNSKESTRFNGEITNIWINKEASGFFIQTTYASYWYDTKTEKYIIVNPYPSTLIEISSDFSKLTFNDIQRKSYGVFVFNKKEMDPLTILGTYTVVQGDIKDAKWINNSNNILFIQNGKINIIEYNGDNLYNIADEVDINLIDSTDKYLYILKPNEKGFDIGRYQIN